MEKYYGLGGLYNRNVFLQSGSGGGPLSRHQPSQFLLSVLMLGCRWLSSHCIHTCLGRSWGEGGRRWWVERNLSVPFKTIVFILGPHPSSHI